MNEKAQPLITMQQGALTPGNFEGLWRLSEIMAASGMMPKNIERPETVFVAVQMGLEVGLSPMQAVQNIAVVNGRPTIWGDAMIGLVRGSGLLDGISETLTGEGDNMTATCVVSRKGEAGETIGRFSVADAKKAALWGKAGPWTQYPKRMLQMRARGYALRDKFADVLKGLYAREEIEPEQYMGPVEVVSSAAALREIQHSTKPAQKTENRYVPLSETDTAPTQPDSQQEPAAGPASTDWPKTHKGNLYDSRGVVWDGLVHGGGKTCNADGTWRRRKGVSPEQVAQAEARYPKIDPLTAFGGGPAVEKRIPGTEENWDNRKLGADPKYVGVAPRQDESAIDAAVAAPFDLAPTTGPTFSDALRWIEEAHDMDELDVSVDASKDVDMTDEQRQEINRAAMAQAAIIKRG